MKEHKCEKCDKEFSSEEGLEMHTSAVHEPQKKQKKPINKKKVRNWLIVLGIIVLIGWGISSLANAPDYSITPANEINIGSHQNIATHIHPELEIYIDDVRQDIPSSIGVSSGIMRPVHTHDSTGVIHVEGPVPRDFLLGDFFLVWGKDFNSTCLLESCGEEIEMTVNGVVDMDYENLILKDKDKIVLRYSS